MLVVRFRLIPNGFLQLGQTSAIPAPYCSATLVTEFVTGTDYHRRNDLVRLCASGKADTSVLTRAARNVINRYAPLAALINDFYLRLHIEDRGTPYPSHAIEKACADAELVIPRPRAG